MLIVGVTTKLRRQRRKGRRAPSWWLNLSPVIAQLYDAGGYDMLVGLAVTDCDFGSLIAVRITCRTVQDSDSARTARLWIADDMLRGTLRLPSIPLLQGWPDVTEGLLSAHDPPIGNPGESSLPPYLTWEGAVE